MQFKRFCPNRRGNAPRISDTNWNQYKDALQEMHEKHFTRAEMLATLSRLDFHPTIGQLNTKMTAWGMGRYSVHTDNDSQGTPSASGCGNTLGISSIPANQAFEVHNNFNARLILSDEDVTGLESSQSSLRIPTTGPGHHSPSEKLRECLDMLVNNWASSLQDHYRQDFSADELHLSSEQVKRWQILVDIARISDHPQTAFDLNMVLLSDCRNTLEVSSTVFVDALIRHYLIISRLKKQSTIPTLLFDIAKEFFLEKELVGAASCMSIIQSQLTEQSHQPGSTGHDRLALYLLDCSPLKLGDATIISYENVLKDMDSCESVNITMLNVVKESMQIARSFYAPTHKMTPSDAPIYISLLQTMDGSGGSENSVFTPCARSSTSCTNALCPFNTTFSIAMSSLLIFRWSILRSESSAALLFSENTETATFSTMADILSLDHRSRTKLLLDQWLAVQDSSQNNLHIRLDPFQPTIGSKLHSHGGSVVWNDVELMTAHPASATEAGLFAFEQAAKEAPDQEFFWLSGAGTQPFVNASHAEETRHLNAAYQSKAPTSMWNDSHSSWSLHRGTGFPKYTSSMISDSKKLKNDFEDGGTQSQDPHDMAAHVQEDALLAGLGKFVEDASPFKTKLEFDASIT